MYIHVHVADTGCDDVMVMSCDSVSWFQVSSLSLGLSQDTVNQVLGAVGLNSATGDM